MVLRELWALSALGTRCRPRHRNTAARDFFPILFRHSASHMQGLRDHHAGSGQGTQGAAGALALDASDPLASFAGEFHHPYDGAGRKLVYLCGHSLGLQPVAAAQYVEQELKDWQRMGVTGHHAARRPWIPYHEQAAAPLAALAGAHETEIVAMNSLTVNLHLMMVSFFRPESTRNRVLMEKSAFPSDRYAVVSQLAFHGLNADEHLIEVEPRPGE